MNFYLLHRFACYLWSTWDVPWLKLESFGHIFRDELVTHDFDIVYSIPEMCPHAPSILILLVHLALLIDGGPSFVMCT